MSDGINFMKDMVGCRGRTPLSWAAREGRTKIAEALLQGGSDPDEKDARGSRPLEIALKSKHKAIAQLLIDSGASCHNSDLCETDINVLNSDGNSLVLMASELVMKVLCGIF
ncbi:hypothetical protein BN1723_006755 [Verticillium longisporum]|uniref:Uncharacterized protein n=1 Tax=Verticillium longisporum TaxID=100787 RepID=A0A0G4NHA6_VERLO|nr:hypothetical protein BN1723_006755 [Verticillium longisporum]